MLMTSIYSSNLISNKKQLKNSAYQLIYGPTQENQIDLHVKCIFSKIVFQKLSSYKKDCHQIFGIFNPTSSKRYAKLPVCPIRQIELNNIKKLVLKNERIDNVQFLQFLYLPSLETLQLDVNVNSARSLVKCRFPGLQTLNLKKGRNNGEYMFSRIQLKNSKRIDFPEGTGSKFGTYLKYIKLESKNKRQIYLNYLGPIPAKKKCLQQQYIQFQMEVLYCA